MKHNQFYSRRDQQRGNDRERIWGHALIVAVLSIAILGVAITGGLSQIV